MPIYIRDIVIPGKVILAPMDGYTSQPFRVLARRLGSSASYSEFIGAIDIVHHHPSMEEKLAFSPLERPFAYQLFDNDPDRIFQAALKLRQRNPDFFDFNIGCSARHVSSRGAGAGLLKEPEKITEILELLVNNMDIPITAKIRLGWDDKSLNYLEVSKRIEQAGCSAIAVHARTRQQGYGGIANWSAIREIKKSVSIPVIGNGDIRNFSDIDRMCNETGCDAVMIGRTALSNPWIFSGLDREIVPKLVILQTVNKFLQLMQSFYGDQRGVVFSRKFIAKYIAPYAAGNEIRHNLLTATLSEEVLTILKQILGV
jgi:tRNA-dihydrouridine synthase B